MVLDVIYAKRELIRTLLASRPPERPPTPDRQSDMGVHP